MSRFIILTGLSALLAACAQTGRSAPEKDWPIPAVYIEEPVHFGGSDGKLITIPAGDYRVEAVKDTLRLTALAGSQRFTLPVTTRTHTPVPTGCAVLVAGEDVRQLSLTRHDGMTLTAAGTISGARMRDGSLYDLDYYDPLKTQTWNEKLSRLMLAPSDFEGGSNVSYGDGTYVAASYGVEEVSAFAPIHLPPGAWVAGLHFSWVRDWNDAQLVRERREQGLDTPDWLPMACILWSRDFAQREAYTLGFVDTLAACTFDDEEYTSNPKRLVDPQSGLALESVVEDWQGTGQFHVTGGTSPTQYSVRPLVIGSSGIRLKRKVKAGETLWVELRIPHSGGTIGPKPCRRVLSVAVEYYIPISGS